MITLIAFIALAIAFIAFLLLFNYKAGRNNNEYDKEMERWVKSKQDELKIK